MADHGTPSERIMAILQAAKTLAREYRELTAKPLGVTGEIAEYEAARLLELELTPARQAGYDAVDRSGRRFQIKGRCLLPGAPASQRIGSIAAAKEFDAVLLVLLDERFDALEIWEADRHTVLEALMAPGSKARNERGALGVPLFKRIARLVWSRVDGPIHVPSAVESAAC